MNIGMVTLRLSPGGAQRLVLEEAKSMQNFDHSVTIYPRSDDPDFREEVGVDDIYIREFPKVGRLIGTPKTDTVQVIKWLRKKFKDDNIDFVVSHYNDIEVYLATLHSDIKYSCHVNGSPFWFKNNPRLFPHKRKAGFQQKLDEVAGHAEFHGGSISPISRVYHEFLEKLRMKALQNSEAVTTLTERVASELSFCYGVHPHLVRPGVSKEWFDRDIQVEPKDIPEVTTDYMLFNVGRLDVRKRNALLLKAFAKFLEVEKRSDVTLVIGGSGEEEVNLQSLMSELEIMDHVVFAGYIPENQLPKYYSAADVLTHPAWVAYGLVPLEAYVLGTKVALSTDTMVREIIEGEPNVDIIPPRVDKWESKIGELLARPEQNPDKSAVPTWSEFGKHKYDIYKNLEIM